MTHKDIYTKFMIEYDKANVTSSYPSLTEYEVATVLDKAYNALISQKVTGNNVRRSTFESDVKSIADLGPLTKSKDVAVYTAHDVAPNALRAALPADLLYFLQGSLLYNPSKDSQGATRVAYNEDLFTGIYDPMDSNVLRRLPVRLVNHETAVKFMSTAYNIPWVKIPVCYIEDRDIVTIYDPLNPPLYNINRNVIAKTSSLPEYNGVITNTIAYYDGTIYTNGKVFENVVFLVSSQNHINLCDGDDNDHPGELYTYKNGSLLYSIVPTPADVKVIVRKIAEELIERGNIYVIEDYYTEGFDNLSADSVRYVVSVAPTHNMHITYIRIPNTFVKDLPDTTNLGQNVTPGVVTYFEYTGTGMDNVEFNNEGKTFAERYTFECNSTVAEELISLAVAFALENVESSRLNAKLNMRGLEA